METTPLRKKTWPPLEALKTLFKNYVFVITASAILALLLRHFVLEAFFIPSEYMSPTLKAGDHIFVYKLAYKFSKNHMPANGDVIIFTFPNEPKKEYIKRVVGVAGDKIEIARGKVLLNGKEISESNASSPHDFTEKLLTHTYNVTWNNSEPEARKMIAVNVPENHVFVLGDNRAMGHDSRVWGFLPVEYIKGKALWIWFSDERSRMFRKVP